VIYTNLPALVLATPLVLACLCFAFARRRRVVQLVSLLGVVGWLAMAANLAMQVHAQGTMVTEVGGWDRHYGISFVADQLGAMMVVLAAFIQLAVGLAAHARLDRKAEAFWYHGLTYCLAFGVTGAFLTADLFNLFVWFEVLLISSFVLMVHGGSDRQLAGGMKYVTLNLISSVMFLAGCGLTYAHTGAGGHPRWPGGAAGVGVYAQGFGGAAGVLDAGQLPRRAHLHHRLVLGAADQGGVPGPAAHPRLAAERNLVHGAGHRGRAFDLGGVFRAHWASEPPADAGVFER
jgi:formate hydrogenlyase subunit 3/multisubunit Na+/H+ antiporter MnhD subunit